MVLKMITIGSHEKSINGKPILKKGFDVSIDSTKKLDNQVHAKTFNNGVNLTTKDSLQNFINNLANNDNSLFQLLKHENQRISGSGLEDYNYHRLRPRVITTTVCRMKKPNSQIKKQLKKDLDKFIIKPIYSKKSKKKITKKKRKNMKSRKTKKNRKSIKKRRRKYSLKRNSRSRSKSYSK